LLVPPEVGWRETKESRVSAVVVSSRFRISAAVSPFASLRAHCSPEQFKAAGLVIRNAGEAHLIMKNEIN
jgi:hypothetical protein